MSIITKIAIVLLVVLNLLAIPLFIKQATIAPNWRHAHEREVQKSKVLANQLRQQQIAARRSAYELALAERTSIQREEELTEQIRDRVRENANLRTQIANQDAKLSSAAASLQVMSTAQKLNVEQRKQLQTLLTDAREDRKKLADSIREYEKRIDLARVTAEAKDKQIEALNQRIRDLEGEKTEMQNQIEDLIRRIGTASAGRRGPDGSGRPTVGDGPDGPVGSIPDSGTFGEPQVQGRITAVRGALASINVGSAQGIRQNMRLYVYRGGVFLGWLTVQEVGLSSAAGVITNKQADIRQGDLVASKMQQ